MEIHRIDSYDDPRFSARVLCQHGAFVADGLPCAFEIIGLRTARVSYAGADFPAVAEAFRFYAEHITRFVDAQDRLLLAFPDVPLTAVPISDLQPSQFCVDEKKVRAVDTFVRQEEDVVIPVLEHAGRLIACDGHTRLYAAVRRGLTRVLTFPTVDESGCLPDFAAEAQARGVFSSRDLPCIPHADYQIRWNQFCDDFFAARAAKEENK